MNCSKFAILRLKDNFPFIEQIAKSAAALAPLPEQTQEEIFLYYFQHLTHKEIGEQSGWTCSTIGRHVQLALKRLKEEMGVLSHE